MSFLLDTNAVSEWVTPRPNPGLIEWMESTDGDRIFLSVVSLAGLRFGVERMVAGKRRRRLEKWLRDELPLRFEGRILCPSTSMWQTVRAKSCPAASRRDVRSARWRLSGGNQGFIVTQSLEGSTVAFLVPRIYFAQARDGLFFRRFAEVHPRYQTPGFAILAQGIWGGCARRHRFLRNSPRLRDVRDLSYGLMVAGVIVYCAISSPALHFPIGCVVAAPEFLQHRLA